MPLTGLVPEDPNTPAWQLGQGTPQQPPANSIPQGGPYYTNPNAGVTQLPGGADAWNRDHSIDPNTGALIGSPGLVPHQYGLQIQALHEQAVWQHQQRLLNQAGAYGRGALNLLQSYRPGGGAAIESGIYGQLANTSIQRAQLTQPMDLLADFRREEDARARMKANRQQERATAVQIAGIAAGAITGGIGYAAIGGALGAYMNQQGQGGQQGQSSQPPLGQQSEQPVGPNSPGVGPTYGPPAPGQAGPGPQANPLGGGMQAQLGQEGPPGSPPAAQGPGQQPGSPGGSQDSPQGGSSQQGAAAGATGGAVGANGDFSPLAYSVQGAQALMHPIQQIAMARVIAYEQDNDPTWQGFHAAVDARLAQRYARTA